MFRVTFALLLAAQLIYAASPQQNGGTWSRQAISIWGAKNEVRIPSPDGKKAIVARINPDHHSDEVYLVTVRASGKEFQTRIGSWVNSEVLWSLDSKAFVVTYSTGGNVGTYHVKVFHISPSRLHSFEPLPNGRKLFAPWCFENERPNVGAIRWMGRDSSKLLIAVEVPPHSSCASMGTFRAFAVNIIDGTVIRRFGQLEAKRLFGDSLGVELKNADDSCVRKPETCVPDGLKRR